jgi:hypothetical protein
MLIHAKIFILKNPFLKESKRRNPGYDLQTKVLKEFRQPKTGAAPPACSTFPP